METILKEANTLLSKPLEERDLQDLSRMSLIKYRIACLIPLAKKDVKMKELEADNIEKDSFLRFRDEKIKNKTKDTQDDMKAKSRLNKNVLLKKIVDLEFVYLQLYSFYQELADAVINTRLVLKL
jgi:hypothetical protein